MSENLELKLEVRGSHGILFKDGGMTGNMKEHGLSIDTVYHSGMGIFGGCIDRIETRELRDFLNKVIELWDNQEDDKLNKDDD